MVPKQRGPQNMLQNTSCWPWRVIQILEDILELVGGSDFGRRTFVVPSAVLRNALAFS